MKKLWKNRAWLRRKLVKENRSQKEVARICGCTPATISRWVRKLKVYEDPAPIINLECIDSSNGRFYKDPDGKFFPSVTTKIEKVLAKGEGFYRWLGDSPSFSQAMEYRDKKGKLGTQIHKICTLLATGEKESIHTKSLPREVIRKVMGFVNFVNEFQPNFLDCEFLVINRDQGYAGRVDMLVELEGDIFVLDVKTSKRIYPSDSIQTMFYRVALSDDLAIDGNAILLLKDSTSRGFQFKKCEFRPDLVKSVNDIYDYVGDPEPRIPSELPEKISLNFSKKVR